jgi:hypothetical protein
MSKEINVYWAVVGEADHGIDRQLMMAEPVYLRKTLFDSRNKSNKMKQNFLKCPAVTNVVNNTLIWKAPLSTSVDVDIVDGKMEPMKRYSSNNLFDWYSEHPPTISNNVLITFDYHIIFFADEEVDVLFTAPYFSEAPHLQYGAIVPGKFDVGSWFRPYNAEMNLWEGNTHMEFKEDEPIAYFTFLTDKKIKVNQFRMTEELRSISMSMTASIRWLPNRSLADRYDLFRKRRLKGVILNKIKENLV